MIMNTPRKFNIGRWLRSRVGLILIVFLIIAAFFLVTEHKAHLFGLLPYALLVLSLLLFIFIRRGQNSSNMHDNHHSEDGK